jgi:alpha-mannosidase
VVLHIKQAQNNSGVVIRLLNASDTPRKATIKSGLLNITGADRCDLLENIGDSLTVENGSVSLEIPARQITVVRLNITQ